MPVTSGTKDITQERRNNMTIEEMIDNLEGITLTEPDGEIYDIISRKTLIEFANNVYRLGYDIGKKHRKNTKYYLKKRIHTIFKRLKEKLNGTR